MMDRRRKACATFLVVLVLAGALPASAQVSTGKYLYTKPDPAAPGGIKGKVTASGRPLVAAFALPPDVPASVYSGTVGGKERNEFSFDGLPEGRYDLLLVFDDEFHEGLTLARDADTLTSEDRESIQKIVGKSEPYFDKKEIHRLRGKNGSGEQARCICTFMRTKESVGFVDGKTYPDHRRSLKLVLLEQVGPGWQVAKTREIHTAMVKPGSGLLKHVFRNELSRIRVVDKVKDLGELGQAGQTPAASAQ